jgi:cytochrome oxidase Cu insertion factor (SCO1/SenC/PrrC family)
LAVLTFGIAYYGGNRYRQPELPRISGILLRPASPVPEFSLTDQQGEPFTQANLQQHWSLLALDPGPGSAGLRLLAQVHNRLASDPKRQRQTRFILVSPQISKDIAPLGENFIHLSGDTDEVFSRFGVNSENKDFTLYIIDPEQQILALFTHTQDAATIASDIKLLSTELN